MKTSSILILLLFVLVLYGCSGASYQAPRERIIEKKQTINLSYDETWDNIIQWFSTHNSPIKTMDKSSGLIATDYNLSITDYRRYTDCGKYEDGSMMKGEFTNPMGNFNVLVKKNDENSTNVTVNCFFNVTVNEYGTNMIGTNRQLVASTKIDCVSTGNFEKEFFNYLKP